MHLKKKKPHLALCLEPSAKKKKLLSSTFLLFWNFRVWIRQFQLWLISTACCLSAHVVKSKRVHWGAHLMLHHTRPSKLRVFLHQRVAILEDGFAAVSSESTQPWRLDEPTDH